MARAEKTAEKKMTAEENDDTKADAGASVVDEESDTSFVTSAAVRLVVEPSGKGVLAKLAGLHHHPQKERIAFMFVVGVAAAMLFPFLGAIGFFDPWESHYGEVARQMAQRDDYLYPFWKDSYFFSKPILIFWLTAPLYALVGAGHAERELPALVELCGRLPIATFAFTLVVVVTVTVRRLVSLRAAVFAGVIVATAPFFGFVGRQAITDMLYVAPMSVAMCLMAIAFFDDDKGREHMKSRGLPNALIGLFALALFPQLWEIGRTAQNLNRVAILGSEQATRIAVSALLVGVAALFLLFLKKRATDPLAHAAAFALALGTLGKGPHAVALCFLPYVLYFVATNEWKVLKRPAVLTASALYLAVAAPWVIVMLIFKGKDDGQKTWFTRFVLYDLFGRLGGVHGERGTFDYYVRYLSYGLFPWTPLLPIALLDAAAARLKPRTERTPRDRFVLFVVIWIVSFFTFFTVTETKFHHYILPLVIPSAILIAAWFDKLLDGDSRVPLGISIIMVLATVVVGRDLVSQPWQLVDLFSYHYVGYKPDYYFPSDIAWRIGIGIVATVVVILVTWGILSDAVLERGKKDTPVFSLLTLPSKAAAAVIHGGSSSKNGGFVAMTLLAAIFSATCAIHVYMANASQHWSHRWIMKTYWSMSAPGEPILSYQMDWKGETFYSHNTEVQIKKSAADLKKAIEKPGRAFVIVQQDRFNRLKSAVGSGHADLLKVVDRSNTKWFLVLSEDPPAKAPDAKAPDAKAPDAKAPDAKAPDAKAPDAKAAAPANATP